MPCDILEHTQQMTETLRACASNDPVVQARARLEITQAIETPIRAGVFAGSIVGTVFTPLTLGNSQPPEYPIDPIPVGQERFYSAYTMPDQGRVASRKMEGTYVTVDIYRIVNGIDVDIRWVEDARWDVVARAAQAMEGGFVMKLNDDAFHTLLTAAYGRGITVVDSQAPGGLFTKRLQSQMKLTMQRYAGGNSTSVKKGRLTHLFMSLEGVEDVRAWDLTQVDDITRREIYVASNNGDDALTLIGGTKLVPLYEFGVNQMYQNYWTGTLGGSAASGKSELVIGIDKSNDDCFVHPVRSPIQIFPDPTMHRQQEMGWYGWTRIGFGCLNSSRTIAGWF